MTTVTSACCPDRNWVLIVNNHDILLLQLFNFYTLFFMMSVWALLNAVTETRLVVFRKLLRTIALMS